MGVALHVGLVVWAAIVGTQAAQTQIEVDERAAWLEALSGVGQTVRLSAGDHTRLAHIADEVPAAREAIHAIEVADTAGARSAAARDAIGTVHAELGPLTTRLEGLWRLVYVALAGLVLASLFQFAAWYRARRAWHAAEASRHADQEREALFDAVFATMQGAAVLVDAHGRIRATSAAARRLLGDEVLVGRPFHEIVRIDDGEGRPWPLSLARVRDGVVVSPVDRFKLHTPAGPIAMGLRAAAAGEGGLLMLRDVTDELARLQEVVQQDRLVAVGTLAAGVAHEANNPLSYVLSNVEYALERGEGYAAEVRDALVEARQGALRVARIVQHLQMREDDPVTEEVVRPRAVIERTLRMSALGERPARLTATLTDVPGVKGSDAGLGQAVLHLVLNALAAVDERGRVDVRLDVHEGKVRIEVEDDGPGIPDDVKARMFDPYFTTRPFGRGSGLGLATVRREVLHLGGTLIVDSAMGRGTRVTILLPPAGGVAAPHTAAPVPAGGAVLVVDDEPQVARAVARSLRATYEVVVCHAVDEALEHLAARDFALVLCDLMMPEKGGRELFEALRRDRPEVAARLAFITGGATTAEYQAFLDACGRPVVAKPFTAAELRAQVAAAIAAQPPR